MFAVTLTALLLGHKVVFGSAKFWFTAGGAALL
jgi:hypothetical protein